MTTSTTTKITLPQKTTNLTELFEDPNGFISTPRAVTKISENFTKVSSFILINKMFDFFTRKGKEFGIFSLTELSKICKKSESTVREALKETKEKGALIVEDIPNIGKLIMINKPKNKRFLKDYLEGKETLYIPHKNKIGGSVDATPPSDTQEGQVVNSVLQIQSSLPLNRLEDVINTELCQSPIDPIYIDPINIDHHHIEKENLEQKNKLSTEKLNQTKNNNADDFSNKFSKEEAKPSNDISQEIKTKSSSLDRVTHNEKLSGGAVADVDRFKSIVDLALSVQYPINNELKSFDLHRPTLEKKLKEVYSNNFDTMEEVVKTQVDAFKFRVGCGLDKLGGIFINCLTENRVLPESYTKYIQEQKDLQDESEYLKLLEIWQGYPAAKKNIKTNLLNQISRDICRLKDEEKNPSYNNIKKSFITKVQKIKQFCDFNKLIETFNQNAKDRCFMIMNEAM